MGGINSMKQYQQYFALTGVGKSTRCEFFLSLSMVFKWIDQWATALCLEFLLCLSFHFITGTDCDLIFILKR